ncbi:MAG: hypothetical protein HY774_16130 [Acidobacteria bacterium]|nr:hypothetical protein [Acidobacteriota bacterium]
MNYKKPSFTNESDPNRQPNWYDLKEMLFQAIKKQFRFVPPPVKNHLKKLSPAQLESVLDILPQFSEIQYLETHLTELSQNPPEYKKDRFRQPAPSFDRQYNREYRPSPVPPKSEPAGEVPRRIETPEPKPEPVQERVIDEPVVPKAASEPEEKISPAPEPAPVQPVQPPRVFQPVPPKQPLPAPKPAMTQSWVSAPPAASAGVVQTTIPVSIEGTQLELVFEYDRFADRENRRGVRFSFSMDETQFLVAQLLTQRERIQPIEPRVAQAIESFFGDAEQVLRGAVQATRQGTAPKPKVTERTGLKTEPALTSDPLSPDVKTENTPPSTPTPVQLSLPVGVPDEDDQISLPAPGTQSTDELPRKRHRRTNEELAAAGIPVGKRTRLTSEKIDLDALKFDPRMASILSIDQAEVLNIAPVCFLEDSTDVLVLFVEPEGKVRIYTYFNRVANRAALAALVGISPENREQVKIRTFRVSQEYLNQFLAEAANVLASTDAATPELERPVGAKDRAE